MSCADDVLPLSLLNGVGALPLTQFSVVQVGTYQELKKTYDDSANKKQDGKISDEEHGRFVDGNGLINNHNICQGILII